MKPLTNKQKEYIKDVRLLVKSAMEWTNQTNQYTDIDTKLRAKQALDQAIDHINKIKKEIKS